MKQLYSYTINMHVIEYEFSLSRSHTHTHTHTIFQFLAINSYSKISFISVSYMKPLFFMINCLIRILWKVNIYGHKDEDI